MILTESGLYLRTKYSLPHLHILIKVMRWFACVLECVSQCGWGSLLTWLTHLPWLTNIKRANHYNLLSTDSDVDSTQRVPRLSMLIDLQTEVRTKHRCLGESRPKECHTVHCTSIKKMEHTTEFYFQCVGYNSSPFVREKSFLYAKKEPPEFCPFKSKYSSAGCMSYNWSLELCWRSPFVRLLVEWGSKVHNECVCMFNESSERLLNSGNMSEDEIGSLPWQK